MKKRLTAILVALTLLFTGAKAQKDSINAYLLTCEPGKAIYELFGHTAIWIENVSLGTDEVFNYGLFDFNTPHFVWKFTLGKTDYLLGSERILSFLSEYNRRGSEVYAQKLNISNHEARRLDSLLQENKRPQNRIYRYNFLFNNCATMAIDKVEQSINGTVTYQPSDSSLTFRDILTRHTQIRPWSQFGIDLIIGADGDNPVGYRQAAFAPLCLKDMAAESVITDQAGVQRPLISGTSRLVNPTHSVDFGHPVFTPMQVMWMLFLLILLICLIGWYRSKALIATDIILFGVQGLGGIVIAVMFFFSEHPTLDTNWLVVCLNPLPLIFLPFALRKARKGMLSIFMICETVICGGFLLLYPAIPQKIETAVLILIGTFCMRAFSNVMFQLTARFRKETKISIHNGHIPMLLLALSLSTSIQAANSDKTPKLVVGIVVDQLDEECLEKMMPIMGSNGIKLMWTYGYNRTDATFDFDDMDLASAVTSIYTGASPFQHGIVAGRWMNPKTLLPSSLVDDSNFKGINTIEMSSPRKLLSTNLADEMKLGSSSRSKVCSIAIERDAAILAGGHDPDIAIWMNSVDGRWSSSEYYGALPEWINQRNDSIWRTQEWSPALPTASYIRYSEHERFRPFSYKFKEENIWDFRTTPMANDRVTEIALASIDGMGLGSDDTPDLLTLTYYAGNYRHSPNSIWSLEQQDIYVRLDQTITELISTITSKLGLENVLFFLTSTGYTDNATPDLKGTRIPTGQVSMARTTALLSLYLSAKFGSGNWISTYHRNQIYLDHQLIEDKGLALHEVLDNCVDLLVQVTGIKSVVLIRDLMSSIPDIESARKRNGINASISGDIILEVIPGWGISDEKDDVVTYRKPVTKPFPMILYGNGIRAEINHEPISICVLAPTIANITRCNAPNATSTLPLRNIR